MSENGLMIDKEDEDMSTYNWDIEGDSIIPGNVIISTVDKNQLHSDSSPFTLTLRINEFVDEREFKKYIKCVESQVRNSVEYRMWTSYIRETLGQYTCALTGEIHSQTSVDIHHHPVALYSIVKAIINKYLGSGKDFCSFDISTDVIELHYQNRVGYIPIVSSLHEKFHNGFLQIPMELIYGDWKYITYQYEHSDDEIETIVSRIGVNKKNCDYKDWTKDVYKKEQTTE